MEVRPALLIVNHDVTALQQRAWDLVIEVAGLVVHVQRVAIRPNARAQASIDRLSCEGSVPIAIELVAIARSIDLYRRLALQRAGHWVAGATSTGRRDGELRERVTLDDIIRGYLYAVVVVGAVEDVDHLSLRAVLPVPSVTTEVPMAAVRIVDPATKAHELA